MVTERPCIVTVQCLQVGQTLPERVDAWVDAAAHVLCCDRCKPACLRVGSEVELALRERASGEISLQRGDHRLVFRHHLLRDAGDVHHRASHGLKSGQVVGARGKMASAQAWPNGALRRPTPRCAAAMLAASLLAMPAASLARRSPLSPRPSPSTCPVRAGGTMYTVWGSRWSLSPGSWRQVNEDGSSSHPSR